MTATSVFDSKKGRVDVSRPPSIHNARWPGEAYLEEGGTIEKAQAIAFHESPKTTKLYDRTSDQIDLDEIERDRELTSLPSRSPPPPVFASVHAALRCSKG
jgi:hypothetical protein